MPSFWGITALFCALIASWLVVCAPAMAQSSGPSDSQYEDCSSAEANAEACQGAIDIGGGIEAAAGISSQGTDAVNGALDGTKKPPSASASASASATGSASAPNYGDGVSEPGEGLASITRLPETGGASPAALGLGVLLTVSGLAIRTLVRR